MIIKRTAWVYLLQNKMQVCRAIASFVHMVENQFQTSIKVIRFDNGTEFTRRQYIYLFEMKGILHQRSAPGAPEQNGRVERKHMHLIETAKSIRTHAGLPIQFGGDCILSATHIINKLRSSILQRKSPYEFLYKTSPTYNNLRVVGCLCCALINKHHIDKMGSTARRCVFLGYPPRQKAFKLYDLARKIVFVSRHVKFQENVFPFKSQELSDSNAQYTKQPDRPLVNPTNNFDD